MPSFNAVSFTGVSYNPANELVIKELGQPSVVLSSFKVDLLRILYVQLATVSLAGQDVTPERQYNLDQAKEISAARVSLIHYQINTDPGTIFRDIDP